MSEHTRFLLSEKEIPSAWYNIQADLPEPLPPVLHPGTQQPIGPDDLKLEVMDTTHLLRGHFTDIDELLGSRLKRTLRRGRVVTPSMLVEQKSVRRGEQITILSALGTIEVRSRGKALRDGSPGDLIPVQNLSSKKRLQARVVSPGLVSVE